MRKLLARPAPLLSPQAWNGLAVAGLLGLLANSMAWPLWYSPGGPYPGWMLIMTLPLLLPLRGLLHGRRRTHQWTSFLALLYLMGPILTLYGYLRSAPYATGLDAIGGLVELLFATLLMLGCMYYAYTTAAYEARKDELAEGE